MPAWMLVSSAPFAAPPNNGDFDGCFHPVLGTDSPSAAPRQRLVGKYSSGFACRSLPYLPALRGDYRQSTDWKLEAGSEATWHSNLSTTADVYTHTSPEAEKSAVQAIEHKLGTGTVAKHLIR